MVHALGGLIKKSHAFFEGVLGSLIVGNLQVYQ